MHTRTIPIRELSPSDEAAWRDLAARSIEPNPFYEVDFLVPACRYLRNGRGVLLLVAEEDRRFYACLPIHRATMLRLLRPPVVTSWRHLYGYLGTPLVAPDRSVEALGALLTTLAGTRRWPWFVVLELFGDDGPVASCLRSAAMAQRLSVHVHSPGERAMLRCHNTNAGGAPSTARPGGRSRAWQWRRLCGDWGDPAIVDRSGEVHAANQFLHMEALGWKGRAGTALLSRPRDAMFYREVARRFATSERLRLYCLEVGGLAIAIETNLCAQDGLFNWKVAYDESFARYGPGAQLQLRSLDVTGDAGVAWIDTCADVNDQHQLRVWPDRRRIATLAIASPERGGRALRLSLLLVELNCKLRGLSARTVRYKLVSFARCLTKGLKENYLRGDSAVAPVEKGETASARPGSFPLGHNARSSGRHKTGTW